jgi:glutamate N-acetyltransferase/amino-acid N-acetyltransferase
VSGPAGDVGFFRSRWASPPEGVTELDPSGLAPGFLAAGVHCGLKDGGATDVAIIAVEDGLEVSSALLLTRNASAAAPIRLCRERCDPSDLRAAVINSGNANAATGEQGYADAVSMQEKTARELGLQPRQVAVAETGVIGVPMPMEEVLDGIPRAAAALSADGGESFNEGIVTTDQWPKRCCLRAGGVTISAQAKGAGMIEPGFATMLCFVQTDAVLPDPRVALRAAVDSSFERITVDGQMSTNDTVLLQATGAAAEPLPEGLLEAVLLQLALEIVADGEGATRIGRAEVLAARDRDEAERVVRAIGNSPLVKTALYGRDPNWGRIAQAAGMALAGEEIPELGPHRIDAGDLAGEGREAELSVRLDRGAGSSHLFFSDLTEGYVQLNAEYTT